MAIDNSRKEILIIEVSVTGAWRLMKQQIIKVNRCEIHSADESATFTNSEPGSNLVSEVRKQYSYNVSLLPIIFGSCGKLLRTFVEI